MSDLPDLTPCSHKGCLNHVSHPCEGCGRIAGRRPTDNSVVPQKRLGDFVIAFHDGSLFKGNLFQKDWRKAPPFLIKSIEFTDSKTSVRLEGFNEYNLTFESRAIVGRSAPRIVNIAFVGRDSEKSVIYVFDFTTKHITKKISQLGKEYGNLTSNTWKEGIPGEAKDLIL